jgi:ankyrin repeat protein
MELAKYCIEHGTEKEKLEGIGSALVWAANLGHFDVFVYLAEFEMKNHAEYKADYGGILLAVTVHGYIKIVKYLASCTNFISIGINILEAALRYHQSEIFWHLIKSRTYSSEDLSRLMLCAGNNGPEFMKYLVENGANINYSNSQVFFYAAVHGNVPVLEYLFEQDANSVNVGSALDGATCGNVCGIIDWLCELGPTENMRHSCAILAAHSGYFDILKCLLNHGENSQQMLDELLSVAALRGYVEIVRYLVKNGADVAADNSIGLIVAAMNSNLGLLKTLFEGGADIRAGDNAALNVAITHNNFEMIKYLVKNGAEINWEIVNRLRQYLCPKVKHLLRQAAAGQI